MQSSRDSSHDVDAAAESTGEGILDTAGARLSDASRRVKPLASTAESIVVQAAHTAEVVVAYAVHLSARGLNRVDAYLADRRERNENAPSEPVPLAGEATKSDPAIRSTSGNTDTDTTTS